MNELLSTIDTESEHYVAVEESSLHVLLVESSSDKSDQMRHLLQEVGYTHFSWAKDFSEAQAILELEKIAIAIIAENVGDEQGIELIWGLSSDLRSPPAMIITDEVSRVRAEEAENLGAKDYISWGELTPRLLDRAIRCVIAENAAYDATRHGTDDLIQRIFELEQSYQTLEEQAGENAHLAEQLDLARGELESALTEVVHTKDQLEMLNEEKTKLFSIIGHDLRSPLTSLITLGEVIDMMGDTMTREDLLEYIEGMSGNVRVVNSLLENLLEWARLQMDQVAFTPSIVDLSELASRTSELLGPVGKQKSVTVHNEIAEGLHGFGDLNMVDTVIRNLTNNAVKFTPEGGSVSILAETDESTVTIKICDTGVGVPAERLDTLFLLDKGSTTNGTQGEKGSGLGLILCRDMVEKNGGKIWAESEEGKGSTFCFTLPASAP